MPLKVSQNNETFFVSGKITIATLNLFETYFKNTLSKSNKVIINIDNVIEIDKSGVEIIRTLNNKAILENKFFSIVGYGCKEIYDYFNETEVV